MSPLQIEQETTAKISLLRGDSQTTSSPADRTFDTESNGMQNSIWSQKSGHYSTEAMIYELFWTFVSVDQMINDTLFFFRLLKVTMGMPMTSLSMSPTW